MSGCKLIAERLHALSMAVNLPAEIALLSFFSNILDLMLNLSPDVILAPQLDSSAGGAVGNVCSSETGLEREWKTNSFIPLQLFPEQKY